MASEKQEQANRANAKRSTGPKTAVGKAQSRMNACKHGLTAQNIVIGDEDPKNFDRLRAELWDEWQPRPGMEGVLVDRLAGQIWRLFRVPCFEAALLNVRRADVAASEDYLGRPTYKPEHYMGQALMHDAQDGDTLGKLSRYDAALMNGYTKTLQMLLALQSHRAEEDRAPPLVEALPLPPKAEEVAA
jgi:hypothetical protein